ncbi:MAG: anti-sigma factor antagonist [Phycisphaerales bacterium]|nr:anti-sigma factor antagonist [Phycisphaerales bacterium]
MNQTIVVERTSVGAVAVLKPRGDIDMARAPFVRQAITLVVRDRPPKLVIDLSEVAYMDSSGIATLVEALQVSLRNKITLVLVGINPRVQSAFEITKLVGMFTVKASLAEAMAN